MKSVLEECTVSIHNPVKKNSIAIFKQCRHKATSTQGKKVKMLQSNVALFGQLYISMQSHDSNLKNYFPMRCSLFHLHYQTMESFIYPNPFKNLEADSSHFKSIKKLTVVLYDRTSPLTSVNDAREELFYKRNRSVDT